MAVRGRGLHAIAEARCGVRQHVASTHSEGCVRIPAQRWYSCKGCTCRCCRPAAQRGWKRKQGCCLWVRGTAWKWKLHAGLLLPQAPAEVLPAATRVLVHAAAHCCMWTLTAARQGWRKNGRASNSAHRSCRCGLEGDRSFPGAVANLCGQPLLTTCPVEWYRACMMRASCSV